jgi:hypothetical protein
MCRWVICGVPPCPCLCPCRQPSVTEVGLLRVGEAEIVGYVLGAYAGQATHSFGRWECPSYRCNALARVASRNHERRRMYPIMACLCRLQRIPTRMFAGQLLIACVPGEFTTMAGRRLKIALRERVVQAWGPVHVAISGLTNTYSSYITTFEEYQVGQGRW